MLWAQERGQTFLWSKQREIIEAVRDNRRVAVHSCHTSGKTRLAATIAGWWLDVHEPGEAFVLSSAPTGVQVKALLWREIGRLHRKAGLPGRVNLTEWYIDNELVAFGRKPSEYNESAFQGVHALQTLVIFDESCGIPTTLWTAAESIASNRNGHILAIGNPDSNDGDFAKVCAPGSGWDVHRIGYSDTPNFTGEDVPDELRALLISPEWVEERLRDWGDTALYQSKVEGRFPDRETEMWSAIPYGLVSRCRIPSQRPAQDREDTVEAGVDVGAGGDSTVVFERVGEVAGRWHEFKDPDPMATVGRIALTLKEWGVTKVKIDVTGIGWGIYGRLRELSSVYNPGGETSHDAEIVGVNFGAAATQKKRFKNKRAELWWAGRERSRLGTWDLSNISDEVVAQLTAPRYEILDSLGKIKIEPKDEVIKRIGRSPDLADALLLAFFDGAEALWQAPADTGALNVFANANLRAAASVAARPGLGLGSLGSSPFGSSSLGRGRR